MRKKGKLYVVGFNGGYSEPWEYIYDVVGSYERADTILFTGGADISPGLYGERNICSGPIFARDKLEVPYYYRAVKDGKAILGICRGAQLVTALHGGKLFQHVEGHIGRHNMTTTDGEILPVSSLHHQMMRPSGNFKLLAWSMNRGGRSYLNEDNPDYGHPDSDKDPEVVLYPDIRALAIQGHPEQMNPVCDTNEYFRKLAKEHLF